MKILPQDRKTRIEGGSPRSALEVLADAGATFTKLYARDKRPIGDGWQHRTYSLAEMLGHVATGGNGGMHGGENSSGIVWLDVDDGRFADFLARFPQLRNSIHSTRPDAPGRGKIAIKVCGEVPPGKKFKHDPRDRSPFFEVLSTGNQAAIVGIHPDGASYELTGSTVVEMDRAEFDALVKDWTGQTLEAPPKRQKRHQQPQYTPKDPNSLTEQVKAAWSILGVFEHWGLASHGVEDDRKGETRVLGNGGLLITEDGAAWSIPSNGPGFGGNTFSAWQYCRTHGRTVDISKREFVEILLEMADLAGIEHDKDHGPSFDEIRAEAIAQRAWLHSAAGTEALKAWGFVRVEGPRKTLDALLHHVEMHAKRTANMGLRYWGEKTNQNHQTVKNHFAKFIEADVIRIDTDVTPWIVEIRPLPRLDTLTRDTVTKVSNYGKGQGLGFYAENRPDDAFVYSHHTYKKRRVALGLDEGIGSLGPTSLTVLAAFVEHGTMTRAELMEETGLGYWAVQKATSQLADLSLLDVVDEGTRGALVYDIAEDASEQLDLIRPHLTTSCVERSRDGRLIGVGERRKRRNAYAQLEYAKAKPEPDEARINRLAAKLDKLEGETVSPWVHAKRPVHWQRWDVSTERDWIATLRQVADDLAGLAPAEIAHHMELMGYDETEIALVASGRIRFMRASDKQPTVWSSIPNEQRPQRPMPPTSDERHEFNTWVEAQRIAA